VRSCDVSSEPKQRGTGHQIGLPKKKPKKKLDEERAAGWYIFSEASAATREMRFAPQRSSVSVSKVEEKIRIRE